MPITDFIGRICLPENNPPVRAYVHKEGFVEVFGNSNSEAKEYLIQSLKENKEIPPGFPLSGFQYMLATIWGDKREGDKMITIFGYSFLERIRDWPGNPDIYTEVIKNGIIIPNGILSRQALTCEDTSIILSKEAEHRRNRKNLKDFISNPPHFITDGKGHTKIVPLEKKRQI